MKELELSRDKRRTLIRLLPYWGLRLGHEGRLEQALTSQTVSIKGLSNEEIEYLNILLSHTGLRISRKNEARALQISIEKQDHTLAPITFKNDSVTFHLKPIRKETTNVQTWIHKRIWLPVKESSFSILCHPREDKNILEWLSYLIIQHYMHLNFSSLTDMSFEDFRETVVSELKPLNPVFAERQLSLPYEPSHQWPKLPPSQNLLDQEPLVSSFKPFLSRTREQAGKKLNPFIKSSPARKHRINPFQGKDK